MEANCPYCGEPLKELIEICTSCGEDFGFKCGKPECQHCGNNLYTVSCRYCRETLPTELWDCVPIRSNPECPHCNKQIDFGIEVCSRCRHIYKKDERKCPECRNDIVLLVCPECNGELTGSAFDDLPGRDDLEPAEVPYLLSDEEIFDL